MYHPPGAEVLHSGVSEVQRCVKPGVQSGPRILSYRYVSHRITEFQVLFSRLSQWRLGLALGLVLGFLELDQQPFQAEWHYSLLHYYAEIGKKLRWNGKVHSNINCYNTLQFRDLLLLYEIKLLLTPVKKPIIFSKCLFCFVFYFKSSLKTFAMLCCSHFSDFRWHARFNRQSIRRKL